MSAHGEASKSGFYNMWETKFQQLEVLLRRAKQWAQASTHTLMEEGSSTRCRAEVNKALPAAGVTASKLFIKNMPAPDLPTCSLSYCSFVFQLRRNVYFPIRQIKPWLFQITLLKSSNQASFNQLNLQFIYICSKCSVDRWKTTFPQKRKVHSSERNWLTLIETATVRTSVWLEEMPSSLFIYLVTVRNFGCLTTLHWWTEGVYIQ